MDMYHEYTYKYIYPLYIYIYIYMYIYIHTYIHTQYIYIYHIMRSAGMAELQAGIKIARRSVNNLRYADDTTLKAESEEELKAF